MIDQTEQQSLTDDLLRRLQADKQEAFGELQAQLEPAIRRFIRRLIGSSPAEDDIVQDVFIALYRNLHRIEPIERLRPYLFGIARKRCYTELRRQRRSKTVSLDEPDFGLAETVTAEDVSSPDEVTHLLLLHLEVQEAMERLPEIHRQTLIMFCEENLSYAEIAEIMNTNIGTVKSRIHYAKRALRALLKPATLRAIEAELT